MRIMGFGDFIYKKGRLRVSENNIPTLFTTWRFPRRDKDWQVGEVVQVVWKPRTPGRRILGTAIILHKEPRYLNDSSFVNRIWNEEAQVDGFKNADEMKTWLRNAHGMRYYREPCNKLTLAWLSGEIYDKLTGKSKASHT